MFTIKYNIQKRYKNQKYIVSTTKMANGNKFSRSILKLNDLKTIDNNNISDFTMDILNKGTKKTVKDITELINNQYKQLLEYDIIELNNNQIDEVNVNLKLIKIKDIVRIVKDNITRNDKNIILILGENIYTLSNKFLSDIENININNPVSEITSGSDIEFYLNSDIFDRLTIKLVDKIKKSKPDGSFFKYYNITKFNLTRYGLYKKEDINEDIYKDNCLYNTFKNGGLNLEKLTLFKSFVNNRNIPVSKLNNICKSLKIYIKLDILQENNKIKILYFGNKKDKLFNIGLIDNHYFINDLTTINSYCINNYKDVKNIDNCNRIYKKDKNNYKFTNRFINSFNLIKLMLINKNECLNLISINDLEKTQYINNIDNFESLEYNENNYKIVEIKENNKYDDYYKVFFDFETWADKNDNYIHKPYLCCYITQDNIKKYFYGEYCGQSMLYDLSLLKKKNMLFYAHNAKYDYMFLTKYLFNEKPIIKSGVFYQCDGKYYYNKKEYINICVRDSYKMVSMPLYKFGSCFNLQQEKEIMPYDLYNIKNPIENKFRSLKECLKYVKENEKDIYIKNCLKFKCIKHNNNIIDKINKDKYDEYIVDIILYSKEYCIIDCVVLKEGFNKFRDFMLEITNIDIYNVLTIASLSHNYMIKQDVYNNIYQFNGIIRTFIQKCVVGGRVMCSENKKKKYKGKIADYDANSLYPSTMDRLGKMGGYLQGLPKIINKNQLNMDFLNTVNSYYIKILVKKINIKRKFPLLSILNNKGIRQFTNNIINQYIYIDKISLEDVIKFQGIEFDIIQGYYFNEGRNNKIEKVINYLYNERVIKKKEKNPIQECYKLIMNSSYGKTILKPTETTTKIIYVKNFNKFISYNYNLTKVIKKITNNKYLIELYEPINNQFNMCHIGVEILSMSKRIMNEVMTLAEDNNIDLYYQDTDSIHMAYNHVEKLEKLYLNKYNKNLTGKNMGQFHIDFNLENSNGSIYAVESIFLGKKSYIDKLESIDKDNNIINGYHIRMKGISNESINYKCKELNINPIELYNKLYNGEKIKFDLTAGGKKCCFEFKNFVNVKTKNDFKRDISFN